MAIGAGAVWEYQTGGNQNFGGGYDSTISGAGTDYSQQTTAALVITDLACVTGGAIVTSANGGFTSAMVGNAINIYGGTNFTTGLYFITGYTDGNTVTLDRSPVGASNGSAGTANVGGCLQIPIDAHMEQFVAGNIVWQKNGQYTLLGNISIGTAVGTVLLPIKWIGYNSTRGDNPYTTNRPEMVQAGYSWSLGSYWYTYNCRFGSSRAGGTGVQCGQNNIFYNCSVNNTNSNSSSSGLQPNNNTHVILSDLKCQYGIAAQGSNNSSFEFCFVHDSVTGINPGSTIALRILNCIIDTCTTGIVQSAASGPGTIISGNTFFGNTTAIKSDGGYLRGAIILHNIFKDNTTGISETVSNLGNLIKFNLFHGNSTDISTTYLGALDSTNITGQDPLFVDAANGDFTVQSGSPVINAGLNFANAGVTGAYKINIGVDQDDNAGGTTCHAWAA
jgi:hypothetical protein